MSNLSVKIFADGANLDEISEFYQNPMIAGFTTNPSLMRRCGVRNYERFARDLIAMVRDRPVSFEIFSDEFAEMEQQARKIASWGENVYAKIPVTNSRGESAAPVICRLSQQGVKLNVTALMTLRQVEDVTRALRTCRAGYVSVFAGRIADTGRDPLPIMREALQMLTSNANLELIWASPREVLNFFQADAIGCHVITAARDLLCKLNLVGKDLDLISLETVRAFRQDALAAGFAI